MTAETDLIDDLPWSEMDLTDLRYGIANRKSFKEIADSIRRRESDVRAKAIELRLLRDGATGLQ